MLGTGIMLAKITLASLPMNLPSFEKTEMSKGVRYQRSLGESVKYAVCCKDRNSPCFFEWQKIWN